MKWKYKAIVLWLFSSSPLGEALYYFSQKNIAKSLPTPEVKIPIYVAYARQHLEALAKYHPKSIRELRCYEFGAGQDLMIPMAFYAFGIERQILVDIRKLLKSELVNDTIYKYQRMANSLGLLRVPKTFIKSKTDIDNLKNYYGIHYAAPADARHTGLPDEFVDCVTSTNTLEHVPVNDISKIFSECFRILHPDGLMSFRIDYSDHYSHFDRSLSPYNFLRYSDKVWSIYNPPLHYQNRLRHADYLELFAKAGFEVLEIRREEPSPHDIESLRSLRLHLRFRAYGMEDLAVTHAHIVLRKSHTELSRGNRCY